MIQTDHTSYSTLLALATVTLGSAACGLNQLSLTHEHLLTPEEQTTAPVQEPVNVTVMSAGQYYGSGYGGQVSIREEVFRQQVLDALQANGINNIVGHPTEAWYDITVVFEKIGLDGWSTRVGFTSYWMLRDTEYPVPLATEVATAEKSVSRIGIGTARIDTLQNSERRISAEDKTRCRIP